MKKPGFARLFFRCRHLTVVSCNPKVTRYGSSNQPAAIVFGCSATLGDVYNKLVTPACLYFQGMTRPKKSQRNGNRIKHHGFGKSFALISNSLRNLNIIILADVSIPVIN
jgi:hypothetical protein